jgi:hypothetical protein
MKRASFLSPSLALSTLLAVSVIACGGSTSDPGTEAVTPGNAGGGTSTAGAAGQGQAGTGQAGTGQAGKGNAAGQGQAEGGNAGSGASGSAGSGAGGNAGSGAGGSTGGQAGSGAGGSTGGQAGSGAGSTGGQAGGTSYEPCAGKGCGDLCNVCDPKDPTCVTPAVVTYCAADGQCTPSEPACGQQCKTVNDCPVVDCAPCPGGGSNCPTVDCVNGQCVFSGGGCPEPCAGKSCGDSCSTCTGPDCPPVAEACNANGQCTTETPSCGLQCKTANDCPVADCAPCPGGGGTCPTADCVNGQCIYSGGGCDDPCLGKSCGESCTSCTGPGCPPVAEACDASGQCVPGKPVCGNQCVSDQDCPQQPCELCPDGSQACSQTTCQQNQCITAGATCPAPPPCSAQQITGEGSCKKLLGYAWDGLICQAIDGCQCVGADCSTIFADQKTCEQDHSFCLANACTTDQQCPSPKGPCEICPDGVTASCPEGKCVGNQCEVVYSSCGPASPPCSGKKCGDLCTTCTGNGCPPAQGYCDINGSCSDQKPVCTFP